MVVCGGLFCAVGLNGFRGGFWVNFGGGLARGGLQGGLRWVAGWLMVGCGVAHGGGFQFWSIPVGWGSTEEYEVEIVLSDIVEGLLAKLRSIVTKHMTSEWDFNVGLIDLLASLTQIQLLLNDAEKRQVSDGRVRMWLANFRDVAYDIDDALDEFGYNILQQKVQTPNPLSNHIVFHFNMANKVKTINKSLNGLKDEIASFDLRAEFVNSIPEINLKKEIDSFLNDPENEAQILETPPQYELKELSESDCWSLFKKRAFANKRLLPQELEKIGIGMEIAKKCRRVPWALRVLGGTINNLVIAVANLRRNGEIRRKTESGREPKGGSKMKERSGRRKIVGDRIKEK
uniref:Disease resistance N-terminal domain-containing protein n=1 Tax=Fagus sylvatica TaxID=28930 RepID=A0A2N9J7H0_FAGSY